MKFLVLIKKASLLGAFFITVSCATYQSDVSVARDEIKSGQITSALARLKPLADKKSGDQLVYMLDYATALSVAGQYEEANKVFIAADRLADNLDYLSVSRFTGSLVFSEEMQQYKGDTFEKVFISAHLAFNFLAMGNIESALVEARRLNEKLQRYRQSDEVTDYKKNDFGTYLSALIWEASGSYDDAYIAYESTYKINPHFPGLRADLIRSARLARRDQVYKKWKQTFPEIAEKPEWYDKKESQVIVLTMQGWGPRKYPRPENYRYPELRRVHAQTESVEIRWADNKVRTNICYDVSDAAIRTLQEDFGALMAKRVAGYVAKEVLADQVRQENEALGFLTSLVLQASDRADLRQWSTLPETIQIQRLYLPAGEYQFSLNGLSYEGSETGETLALPAQTLRSGKTQFLVWRALR